LEIYSLNLDKSIALTTFTNTSPQRLFDMAFLADDRLVMLTDIFSHEVYSTEDYRRYVIFYDVPSLFEGYPQNTALAFYDRITRFATWLDEVRPHVIRNIFTDYPRQPMRFGEITNESIELVGGQEERTLIAIPLKQ